MTAQGIVQLAAKAPGLCTMIVTRCKKLGVEGLKGLLPMEGVQVRGQDW